MPARVFLLLGLLAASVPASASAETDSHLIPEAEDGKIVRVDPASGAMTTVSSGGSLGDPSDVAVEPSGDLVVVDATFNGGPGGVIRIDPTTGAQEVVASGGHLVDPVGVAVEPSGSYVVADVASGQIVRVDPATGAQSIVSSTGSFFAFDVAVETSGDIVAVGQRDFEAAVVRIDPETGLQSILSSLGEELSPTGITVEPTGDLAISAIEFSFFQEMPTGTVIRLDPDSGVRTILTSGGNLWWPYTLAAEPSGDLVVAGYGVDFVPSVVRVDDANGAQTLVAFGGGLIDPHGIAVEAGGDLVIADAGILTSCFGYFATHTGTPGNDSITGTPGFDLIVTGDGNDRLLGGTDADGLCSGPGRDVLKGGDGADGIDGDLGPDRIAAQAGSDFAYGGDQGDRISGGGGRDLLVGGDGSDRLVGQGGGDYLVGQRGADSLVGGSGHDRCREGPGKDSQRTCEKEKDDGPFARGRARAFDRFLADRFVTWLPAESPIRRAFSAPFGPAARAS